MQTAMESTVTWYDIMEYNEDMIPCQSCKPGAVISRCKYNIANMVQFTLLEMKLFVWTDFIHSMLISVYIKYTS